MLSELSGHHNKKQKINYLQKIREENSALRHEKFELQTTNQKLESRIRIVEEDLRFYKTEKIKLFSKWKKMHSENCALEFAPLFALLPAH